MAEFSRRSVQIAEHSDAPPGRVQSRPRAERHGCRGHAACMPWRRSPRGPTNRTQPRRAHRHLALTGRKPHVAKDEQMAFVSSLKNRNELPLLGRDDLGEAILSDAAQAVVTTVAEHHSTYGRQNLLAEAHRMLARGPLRLS